MGLWDGVGLGDSYRFGLVGVLGFVIAVAGVVRAARGGGGGGVGFVPATIGTLLFVVDVLVVGR